MLVEPARERQRTAVSKPVGGREVHSALESSDTHWMVLRWLPLEALTTPSPGFLTRGLHWRLPCLWITQCVTSVSSPGDHATRYKHSWRWWLGRGASSRTGAPAERSCSRGLLPRNAGDPRRAVPIPDEFCFRNPVSLLRCPPSNSSRSGTPADLSCHRNSSRFSQWGSGS